MIKSTKHIKLSENFDGTFKLETDLGTMNLPLYGERVKDRMYRFNPESFRMGKNRAGIKQANELVSKDIDFNIEITVKTPSAYEVSDISGLSPRGREILNRCENLPNSCNHTFLDKYEDNMGKTIFVKVRLMTL